MSNLSESLSKPPSSGSAVPRWPVISPAPMVRLPKVTAKPKKEGRFKSAVILPDMQIGFYRDRDGTFVPTHDDVAIDIALSIIKEVKPDEIVYLGDNLDLPEMSKYRHSSAFHETTQASIDRASMIAAQVHDAAPYARKRWLAGNHEERLSNYIIDNAKAAFSIRQGGKPDSWPVLSVPFLCNFKDYNTEYLPGYPASHLWLNENLKIIHGTKHKSSGSTAHMYLNSEKVSVIFGHVHRREWAEKTRDSWEGPKTIMAASPGCLAKTTGAVPSTKGGIDLDGRPLTVVEDWQQGVAVVIFEDSGRHQFFYEQVPIHSGVGFYRGKVYGE